MECLSRAHVRVYCLACTNKGRNTRRRLGISLRKSVRKRLVELAEVPMLSGIVAIGLAGLGWLLAWIFAGAIGGADHFIHRVEIFSQSWIGSAVQLSALILVVLHILQRMGRQDEDSTPGSGWLYTLFGLVGLATLVLCKVLTWQAMSEGGATGLYVRISEQLGRPLMWVSLVVGVTGLSAYGAAEIDRALSDLPRLGIAPDLSWGRVIGYIAAVIFWVAALNGMSQFVVGRAFLAESHESVIQAEDEASMLHGDYAMSRRYPLRPC